MNSTETVVLVPESKLQQLLDSVQLLHKKIDLINLEKSLPEKAAFTPDEVRDLLGYEHVNSVYALIRDNQLKKQQRAKRYKVMITRKALLEYLQRIGHAHHMRKV